MHQMQLFGTECLQVGEKVTFSILVDERKEGKERATQVALVNDTSKRNPGALTGEVKSYVPMKGDGLRSAKPYSESNPCGFFDRREEYHSADRGTTRSLYVLRGVRGYHSEFVGTAHNL